MMVRREHHDRPDLSDLRERTDYLASLQDHEAWEALKAKIEAQKAGDLQASLTNERD